MTTINSESALFEPISFRTFTAPNRVAMSPHSTMFAKDGKVTEKHLSYYGQRAQNRVGTLFIGGLRVAPSARSAGCQISVADDSSIEGLTRLAQRVHCHGAKIIGQLLHPGLERSAGDVDRATLSPSSSISIGTLHQPHILTTLEVEELISIYVEAARRCHRAGFDGVEIHAAHGYLAHSFLSPVDNQRTDAYGQDRTLFLKEIIRQCREATGDELSVGARVSINDFAGLSDGSLTSEDMIDIALRLVGSGLDFLDCSFQSEHSPIPDMKFTPFAMEKTVAKFRDALPPHVPIFGVGRILTPEHALRAIQRGSCDGVLLARALIADPTWAQKAYEGRSDEIRPCIGCNQGCTGRIQDSREMRCLTNPEVGHEFDWGSISELAPTKARRRVTVIGAGPAGLEAARVAATLGAEVQVFDRHTAPGGLLAVAAQQDGKGELGNSYQWRLEELRRLNVNIQLGTKTDPETLDNRDIDELIIATGVSETLAGPASGEIKRIALEGIRMVDIGDFDFVCVVDRAAEIAAFSTAVDVAKRGKRSIFVTPHETPASRMPKASRYARMREAVEAGVEFYTSSCVSKVGHRAIQLSSTLGAMDMTISSLEGNGIILETGLPVREEASQVERFQEWAERNDVEYQTIGDAFARRDALHAIREGYLAGRAAARYPVPDVMSF